jgi:S1-C subfamily serine protease
MRACAAPAAQPPAPSLKVGAVRVTELAEFFRAVWRLGAAGVEGPLTFARGGDVLQITVKSTDRTDFLKKPNVH